MRVLLGRLYTENLQAFFQLQTPLNLCIFPLISKCLYGICLHSAASRMCSPGQAARVHLRTIRFICTLWLRQICGVCIWYQMCCIASFIYEFRYNAHHVSGIWHPGATGNARGGDLDESSFSPIEKALCVIYQAWVIVS